MTEASVRVGARIGAQVAGWRERALEALRAKWFVPAVLVLALAMRLVVAVLWPLDPVSDAAWYAKRAMEIAEGLGYQEGGHPTAYWPVGWPLILAGLYKLTGSVWAAVVTAGLAATAVVVSALLWMGRVVLGSTEAGRLAALLYALYPNDVLYTGQALSELTYTALAMLGIVLALHALRRAAPGSALGAGAVFGMASLVKAQTLAFPVVLLAAARLAGWGERRWSRFAMVAAALYLALAVVVAPWTLRNMELLGAPVIVSTNGGIALLQGANDHMTGRHMEGLAKRLEGETGVPWNERVARQVELDRRLREMAVEWIRAHPLEYLAWMPRNAFYLWERATSGFWAFELQYGGGMALRAVKIANNVYYFVILGLSAVGLWWSIRRREARALLVVFAMPAFVTLLAAVFTGQPRYHFPAMPLLVLAAAWTLLRPVTIGSRMPPHGGAGAGEAA